MNAIVFVLCAAVPTSSDVAEGPAPAVQLLLDNGCERIVFAARQPTLKDGHWYANIGYLSSNQDYKLYEPGGSLCILDLKTCEIDVLLEDNKGTIRDPAVHYDARKILFSYRKGDEENFHLYEINVDGTGLVQLTSGPYDDYEPSYLPNGGIVFVSTRARRWVNCYVTHVGTIHRCNGDGSEITDLSANLEHDNTPWVLADGRVLYQRWEYIDRSQMDFHHLWTMSPDGTDQMVYYGNQHPGGVLIDAKPVPDSAEAIAIESPRHGQPDHLGRVVLLTPRTGPDNPASKNHLTKEGYCDPYALSLDVFLAAIDRKIVTLNRKGEQRTVIELPESRFPKELRLYEPRPLVEHAREKVIPSRTDDSRGTGTMLVTDVHIGRKMGSVEKGTIKQLLVLESLPKPINFNGGMDPLTYGGSFTLERILGTVPVEEDGSAFFELPAKRSLFFVALDENEDSVKRMHSFTSVMPGETFSCVGCHEQRTTVPPSISAVPIASQRRPSQIARIEGVPEVYDFPRDIQPVLDRHCVECHNPSRRDGGVLLTGDRGPIFSHSYYQLTIHKQIADGRNRAGSNYEPYVIGAASSPLMDKLRGGHYDVTASKEEIKLVRYWIESAAVYAGTYAALGTGAIGGYQRGELSRTRQILNVDYTLGMPKGRTNPDLTPWETSVKGAEVIKDRCASCHTGPLGLPRHLSDERGLSFWRPDWDDERLLNSRHIMFNLTRPEQSLMVLGPLTETAGGYGACKEVLESGKRRMDFAFGDPVQVFSDINDPDYQTLLAMIQAGKDKLDEVKRFDMPGFQPRLEYIREMKRFGVLPGSFDTSRETVDPYELDQQYWELLWHYN